MVKKTTPTDNKKTKKMETSQPKTPKLTEGSSAPIDPKDPDFLNLQKAVGFRKGVLFTSAKEILQDILNRRPEWEPARRELVLLYMDSQSYDECEKFLKKECQRIPKNEWIWVSLSKLYSITNKPKDEILAIKKVIELNFNEAMARRLFEIQRDSGDLEGALETVLILRSHRDTLELEVAHAKLLSLLNKKEDAQKMCEKLLAQNPIPAGVVDIFVAYHLGDKNSPEAVLNKFLPMIEKGIKHPEMLVGLSRAYHRMDRYEDALKLLHEALATNEKNFSWWYDLSLIQRQDGLISESQKSLERSLTLNPLNPTALRVFGVEHKYEYGDEFMKHVNFAHANINTFSEEKKVELYHAIAKVFEDVGELNTAFKYYEVAGELYGKLNPYNSIGPSSLLKMTRDRVGPKTFSEFKFPRCESEKPVFVLGMPRSGTTLAEQIIATHPEAHGAGELKLLHRVIDGISINNRIIETNREAGVMPTYIPGVDISKCRTMQFKERGDLYVQAIESIAKQAGHPDAKRVVDKMPGNYFWTGVIPYILPNAKIVHTQRHPLDNCLSLYRIYFPDGMPWSYQLKNLGKVSRTYFEHMSYWEKNMPPGMMLTVNYEVVVADFENEAKKIISHIGLEWDEACLRFYDNDRQVKTASLNQVRKPIYNSSVGRWRKYEEFLKPLIKELGPLIKDYEDMIEARLEGLGK